MCLPQAIPCKLFQTTGRCQFGSSCFYRHVDQSGNEAAPEAIKVRLSACFFSFFFLQSLCPLLWCWRVRSARRGCRLCHPRSTRAQVVGLLCAGVCVCVCAWVCVHAHVWQLRIGVDGVAVPATKFTLADFIKTR